MAARKRLFLGLLSLGVLFCGGVGVFLVLLAAGWERPFNRVVFSFLAVSSVVVAGLVALGAAGTVVALWGVRPFFPLQYLSRLALNLLFPFTLALGRMLGIGAERVRASFVAVNNRLVVARRQRFRAEEVLLLAPHCLQDADCPRKITFRPDNCARCGKCQVADLLALRDKYGVKLAFATGGTLARRFLSLYRPRAVVAIACERDLASGIQDSSPLPVLGVVNMRPHGPCCNTRVDLEEVEKALAALLE